MQPPVFARCLVTPEGARLMSTSVKAFPRLTEAEALFRRGLNDQASFAVIQHLRENRNEPRGLALLGEIALETGALVQSEQFLRSAISLGATSYEVQRNLASAILRQDRLGEALDAFTELEKRFDDLHLTATRALILDRLGRTEEAIETHERVIANPRAEARHWIVYAHALRFAGRTEEAIAAYRSVVEKDPERGEAWWGLADIKSKVLTDDDLRTMEVEVARAVDMLNVVPLHMALGRGWHDRGEHERAFRHWHEGNRLRAEIIRYDPDELTREVEEFVQMATPDFFAQGGQSEGPIPIFLVSLPRSGSTLLEQILGRHPEIEAVGELPYIRALMRSAMELRMRRSFVTVPQFISNLADDECRALGAEYLRRSAEHRQSDSRFFIDKMPANWSDVLFISKILPQARFIEIRRNPLDCCFSNYTHHFGSAHAASFDLVHQGRSCRDYTRLMDHIHAVAPGLICPISYEALIEQPEKVLRSALDYLGLDWNSDLLSFYRSDRSVRTPSAEQVRRPLNRQGFGVWKPYARWLGPLIETLGPLAEQEQQGASG
jgi:tetratricopeptide (TPR) repeat protein